MNREVDPLDQASRLTEETIQRGIDEARAKAKKRELKPTGRCHWCEERIGRDQLFCDHDCRDDWQNEQDRKRRNGA